MPSAYSMPPDNITDNGNAIINLLVWESQQVNEMFIGIVYLFGFIIFTVGFMAERRRYGTANALLWLSVSMFIVTGILLIAFLMEGLVSLTALGISTALTIGSAFLFWFTMER